jgi:hypothetical protein
MYNTSSNEGREHGEALRNYFYDLNVLAGMSAEEAAFNANRSLELEVNKSNVYFKTKYSLNIYVT